MLLIFCRFQIRRCRISGEIASSMTLSNSLLNLAVLNGNPGILTDDVPKSDALSTGNPHKFLREPVDSQVTHFALATNQVFILFDILHFLYCIFST